MPSVAGTVQLNNRFAFANVAESNLFYRQVQPMRTVLGWANHQMKKDHGKRQCIKELNIERLRTNALRKNDILPLELRKIADVEIHAQPRNSSITRIVHRCKVTGRARGNLKRWRLSRFVFRHLSDYNKMSGVQRAMW